MEEALTCGELVSVCDGGVVLCLVVLVALVFVGVGSDPISHCQDERSYTLIG